MDGEPGDLLEGGERRPLCLLQLVLNGALTCISRSPSPCSLRSSSSRRRVDLELLLEDALLDLGDLDPTILYLALDLAPERDRLLARLDLRLAAERLGLALGVARTARAPRPPRGCASADQAWRTTDAPTAPRTIPMSAAPAESMLPPLEDWLPRTRCPRMLSPDADLHGRAGLCPDLRQVVGRPPSRGPHRGR